MFPALQCSISLILPAHLGPVWPRPNQLNQDTWTVPHSAGRRGRGAKISNGVLRTWDGLEIVSQLRNHHYHNQLNYTEQWSKFYWHRLCSQAALNVETNGLNQRKWQCVSVNNVYWHGISLYAGQTEIEIDVSQCSNVSLQSRCALGWMPCDATGTAVTLSRIQHCPISRLSLTELLLLSSGPLQWFLKVTCPQGPWWTRSTFWLSRKSLQRNLKGSPIFYSTAIKGWNENLYYSGQTS